MAKTAGMTVDEFKKLYAKDATKALSLFLTGLGKLPAGAQQGVLAIEKLNNIRVIRAMLGLANNAGELNRQLGVGEKAWDENTALANAAGKRYETTAAQLSILKNIFFDMLITIGDSLNPAVKGFVQFMVRGRSAEGRSVHRADLEQHRSARQRLGEAFGHLLDAVNGIFGADSKTKASSSGSTVGNVATGLASVWRSWRRRSPSSWRVAARQIGQSSALCVRGVPCRGQRTWRGRVRASAKSRLLIPDVRRSRRRGAGLGGAAAAQEPGQLQARCLAAKHMTAAAALKCRAR
jgi:hypothetical protein